MIYWTAVEESSLAHSLVTAKWVTPEDRQNALTHKSERAQKRSLFTRGCLRALLAHVTGKDHWGLSRTAQGKPLALTPEGDAGPHISLSHTDGIIACGVSLDRAIGIDIERHRTRCFDELAAFAFGPTEQSSVALGGVNAFYTIWTLRESIAKLSGEGVFATLNGQDCISSLPDEACWTEKGWGLFTTKLGNAYSLSIATTRQPEWNRDSLRAVESALIL